MRLAKMESQSILRHKGLGIASFVIGLVVFFLIFLLFGIAGALKNAGRSEFDSIVGLALFFFWFLDAVGIALGIAGVFDRTSKKTFPILGIAIGAVVLLLSGAAVLIGLSAAT
jgi:hypothetical protein